MPSEMTVQLAVPFGAPAGSPARGQEALAEVEHTYGIQFRQMDEGGTSESLAGYFHAAVPETVAEEVVTFLRQSAGIRAAYVKPAGSAP